MPPLSAPHLIDMLMEVGPVAPAGMGVGPVSWREIAAWRGETGRALPHWQKALLRRLSRDYAAESQRATAVDCPAPWGGDEPDEDARAAIERKLDAAFARFGGS